MTHSLVPDDDILSLESASTVSSMSDLGAAADKAREGIAAEPAHHKEFYIEDEHMKLQAGDTVYRVHTYFFLRESDEARALVKRSWVTADRLVVLDDITSDDLESFFKVLYSRVSESPPLSSKSEWTSVLHLSHTWNFPSIRSLAVRHLFSLTTPVDRVVIGRKYDIEHWLRPAYEAICEREEWLSEAEGERLGLRDVLKIGRARQLLRAPAILREEGERRALLGGVFGDHPSSTADDIPPPRLASASEDDPVQQSLNLSSSVYTENLRTSGDIESLAVREITAATTDSSDDAFGRKPADDHYEAALGPVYAPVTSSIRDQLLRVISEIDLAEEAMMKARVDQQTAEQKQVTLRAQYDSGRGSHTTVSALNTAQKALNDAQQATAAATTYLERAYQNLVLTVSTYCPSLAKSYRISPEARAELMPLLATLTDAERHHTHTATIASQATQHVEYCRAHEDLCSRTCATWHMKEDEDSLHRAQGEARAAVANAQKKQEQEKHAKNKLASAHLALAASLSKLIADAIAHEAPTEAA